MIGKTLVQNILTVDILRYMFYNSIYQLGSSTMSNTQTQDITFSTGIEKEKIYCYSPENEQVIDNIIRLMQGLNLVTPTSEYLAVTAKIPLMATRISHAVSKYAEHFSKDYECGSWDFNDDGIYLLQNREDNLHVINSNNYFSENMIPIEFSLFIFTMAINQQMWDFEGDDTAQEVFCYWAEKLKYICYNKENGFNSSALMRALD